MKKVNKDNGFAVFIPNYAEKKSVRDPIEPYMVELITNKKEAVKAVAYLMSQWDITWQDFVDAYSKSGKKK